MSNITNMPDDWFLVNGKYYAPIIWDYHIPVINDGITLVAASSGCASEVEGVLRVAGFEYSDNLDKQKDTSFVEFGRAKYAALLPDLESDGIVDAEAIAL